MLGLLPADFPAWNLAALTGTDADDAEEMLEQLVDAVLVDVAGVDTTGLIRYRLHDLLRAFARECLAEAEPPGVREESLARLADQYIGAARLASAPVHPGAADPGAAPAGQLLAEDVVRGDPWGWFRAERANLVRLVEHAHAVRRWDRTWRLAELLPVMFDWRSWERTHQLALDAARQAGDPAAEAGIMRSLGALYRELGRYGEAVNLLARAADIFESRGDRQRWAVVLRNLGDACRYQGRLTEAIDAYRGLSEWSEARGAFEACIGIYHDLADRLEEARGLRQLAIVHRNDGDTQTAIGLFGCSGGTSRARPPGGQMPNGWAHTSTTPRLGKGWDGGFLTPRLSWRRSVWGTTGSSPGITRAPTGGSSRCCCRLGMMRLKRGGFGCTG